MQEGVQRSQSARSELVPLCKLPDHLVSKLPVSTQWGGGGGIGGIVHGRLQDFVTAIIKGLGMSSRVCVTG